MTAITASKTMVSVNDGLKVVSIVASAAADDSFTYDTKTDATDGRGAIFEKIMDAYHIGTTGTRVDASWVNSTGIVTVGTVSGGPATVNLFVVGY